MPVPYTTVYQISQRIPDWPFACIGLIPLAVGLVTIWGKRRFKWSQPHWLFAILSSVFGLFWIGFVGTWVLSSDWQAFTAYQKGDYQTVEGAVYDFRPMPYEGHQDECFSVQNQRFCYSDYEIAPGFHNTTSHGGPIREGLAVRIAYRDGRILRLDVPRDQAATSAQSAAATTEGERQWQQRLNSDPFEQEMGAAFLFTAMCWTFWWNLQWKRVMRFWLKPPNRAWTEALFRVFFALNFVGAVMGFVHQVRSHPLSGQELFSAARITVILCAVVAATSAFVLRMAQRRDAKAALRP